MLLTSPDHPFKDDGDGIPHDEEQWEIRAIRRHRLKDGETKYLVCWKDSWLKENDLSNAQILLQEYRLRFLRRLRMKPSTRGPTRMRGKSRRGTSGRSIDGGILKPPVMRNRQLNLESVQ